MRLIFAFMILFLIISPISTCENDDEIDYVVTMPPHEMTNPNPAIWFNTTLVGSCIEPCNP